MPAQHSVHVPLGTRAYDVLIQPGILSQAGALVREAGLRASSAFIITSPEISARYLRTLRDSLSQAGFNAIATHSVPAGEAGKNWDEFSRCCAALLEEFPDAGSTPVVFLLGGGVIGDLGGFAAAVFRRGVPFVQIPTTLLSAVDSSVGGKVAVNFGGVKNIMGAFSQPRLVLCDPNTLQSLSDRELRSGCAEVIKYGLVCSAALLNRLESGDLQRLLQREPETVTSIIRDCVALKAAVVAKDEFDKLGIRNVLNFGHTIGHALELSADYQLTHGEAISIGMLAATRLSIRLGRCGADILSRLQNLLSIANLPSTFPASDGLFERMDRALRLDKKFRDGKNVFVLPTLPGEWKQEEDIPWELVHESMRECLA
jgi:3-dehydroquinate synthase